MYTVYQHISPSGKVYVGITSLRPKKRWMNGRGYYGHGDYPFARAIAKYGWDSFKHEILGSSYSEEEAKQKERELISFYKHKGISYNITLGGESGSGNRSHLGQKASDDTRKKMSESGGEVVYQYSKDGRFVKKWNSQKEAADELRIKRGTISCAVCGRIYSYKGFFWSKLPPEKWIKPEPKHKESGRKRQVYQYSSDGKLINIWESVTEASRNTGVGVSTIGIACNYKNKARSFLWSYWPLEIELKKIEAQKAKSSASSK